MPDDAAEATAPEATAPDASASVRPPDLPPDDVRGRDDVLAGWDTDADVADLSRWQVDRPPFPTDTVVVLAAGVVGALGGAALDARRGRGAARGLLAGVLAAATVRRIWRLDA